MKQLNIYDTYNTASATEDFQASGNLALSQTLENGTAHTTTEQANVTEIIIARDKAHSIPMLLPMLTHLNQDSRWLALIDPPADLLQQWREQPTLNTNDIMVIHSDNKHGSAELCVKALNAGTCHAVVIWTEGLSKQQLQAFETASANGNSHGIVLRQR